MTKLLCNNSMMMTMMHMCGMCMLAIAKWSFSFITCLNEAFAAAEGQ